VDGGIDMAHGTVVAHQETIEQTIPIAQEGVVGTVVLRAGCSSFTNGVLVKRVKQGERFSSRRGRCPSFRSPRPRPRSSEGYHPCDRC
jgi:hypothetical protein